MQIKTYELAGIGERFLALIVDSVILGIISGALGADGRWFLGGVVGFIVGVGYHWYFLTRQSGQTPGKMLLNIRVIKTDGTPISDTDAVLRYIGYVINFMLVLPWLWAVIDSENQGWHDKIAKTYVIKTESRKVKNDTIAF